jgi:rhamnulokinase
MKHSNFLAFDLGATSGRTLLGTLRDGRVEVEELTRFGNGIIAVGGKYYWNILGLYEHIVEGLTVCAKRGIRPDSVGIDTWGVDVVPIGSDGSILGNPRAYRDPYTNGAPEEFFKKIPREEVYNRTGIHPPHGKRPLKEWCIVVLSYVSPPINNNKDSENNFRSL